jgi:hypothetical protein
VQNQACHQHTDLLAACLWLSNQLKHSRVDQPVNTSSSLRFLVTFHIGMSHVTPSACVDGVTRDIQIWKVTKSAKLTTYQHTDLLAAQQSFHIWMSLVTPSTQADGVTCDIQIWKVTKSAKPTTQIF